MNDYLDGWSEFNVAMIGATSALAGLVIVASSVNIAVIVKAGTVTARLASAIVALALALTGAALALIPGIPAGVYGAVVIAAALIATVVAAMATRSIFTSRDPESRLRPLKAALGFLPPLAYLIGGALLIAVQPAGLVWFAGGAIAAIVTSLLISWIALVEVLR